MSSSSLDFLVSWHTGVMAIGIYCIVNSEIRQRFRGEESYYGDLAIEMHSTLSLSQMFSLPSSLWSMRGRIYQRDLSSTIK